jgi:hypothetical protein
MHTYIEFEWPITSCYRTKLISIMGQEDYETKSQVMCFTLEPLRGRYYTECRKVEHKTNGLIKSDKTLNNNNSNVNVT